MTGVVLHALAEALENRPDLLVIDEIGPIQLQDPRFKEAIERLIVRRDLSVLGIISPTGHAYIDEIQRHPRSGVVEVREDNRTELEHELIAEFRPRPTLMH